MVFDFVVYTGSKANHDSQTRSMIRSRAMRDFRHRERTNNIHAFRDHRVQQGEGAEPSREECHPSGKSTQRLHRPSTKMNQTQVDSRPTAPVNFNYGTGGVTYLPGPSAQPFFNTSAGSSSFPSLDSSHRHDDYVFESESALLDTAWVPAAHPPCSHTLNTTYLLQQRPRIYSTAVANCVEVPVNGYAQSAVASQPNQRHCVCEICLGQSAACGIYIATGHEDKPSLQSTKTNSPNYHDTAGWVFNRKPSHSISFLPLCDSSEQSALQYFKDVVVKDVSGIIATGFWEELVLQFCHTDGTVRQAAIALSQAHLAQATQVLSPQCSQVNSLSTASAASEIRAIRALRKYIEIISSHSYELVLTCSIIFYTLDSLLGRETSAILHLENGLKMFKVWQRAKKQARSRTNENAFRSLSTVLARLDLSVTIAHDDRIPAFEHVDGFLPTMSEIALVANLSFIDAHDAHYQLMRVATPTSVFLVKHHQWHGTPARFVPSEIVEEQRMHKSRYRAWDMAMSNYEFSRQCYSKKSGRRAEDMSLLATRMTHWSAERMLDEFIREGNDTCPWDRMPWKLLGFASDLIDKMEGARLEDGHLGHTSFSPEVAASGILLMLAHRTTLPQIRAEALQLAQRFDRKEGVRDICGAFIKWTQLPYPRPPFPFLLGEPGH